MSALQIMHTSESDSCNYEVLATVTLAAVTNKAQKKSCGSMIGPHDLRDTGVMLYQLSYCMKPHWKQVRCEFNSYPFYHKRVSRTFQHCTNHVPYITYLNLANTARSYISWNILLSNSHLVNGVKSESSPFLTCSVTHHVRKNSFSLHLLD